MGNPKLELKKNEKANLRQHKIKISEICNYQADELSLIMNITASRAKHIYALADFQRIDSIGIRFAEDLIFLGFWSVDDLINENGAELTDRFEKAKGYKIDSCVEDQFRLAVDFAKNGDQNKRWWDFTEERKRFRARHGYPLDRPKINWTENLKPSSK